MPWSNPKPICVKTGIPATRFGMPGQTVAMRGADGLLTPRENGHCAVQIPYAFDTDFRYGLTVKGKVVELGHHDVPTKISVPALL